MIFQKNKTKSRTGLSETILLKKMLILNLVLSIVLFVTTALTLAIEMQEPIEIYDIISKSILIIGYLIMAVFGYYTIRATKELILRIEKTSQTEFNEDETA